MENKNLNKKQVRWEVFIPGFTLVLIAALVGLFNNEALTTVASQFFSWSLNSFGWLYQIVTITCLIVTFAIMFSKIGKVRFGGKDAKPRFSFMTWFAMTLTGGVATGIVSWGVNEPLLYYGNVYGELDGLGIEPGSAEAIRFAMGRCFYNWTFIPYAIYALVGVLVAYLYFNRKQDLTVTSSITPLFGNKIKNSVFSTIIDVMSMLGIVLGISSGLAMCIVLLITGLQSGYGLEGNLTLFIALGVIIVVLFSMSSYIGLDKGLAKVGSINAYFYYGLLIFLFFVGPTIFILRNSTAGLAEWFHNFWRWGLDPIDIGGPALVQSWTLYDWAIWIAYAPVTGIFLAQISYGRTVREFLMINLILPSIFGLVWFGVWGNNALHMQMTGQVDLVETIVQANATMALFEFMKELPLAAILIPVNLFVILVSFTTAADATSTSIASMCMRNIPIGSEAPGLMKVVWGVLIGTIAIVMAAFGGGEQGVQGVKSLGTAGGFVVLFIFILQIISAVKVFFFDDIVE